jgi:hypothetical protein
VMDDGSVNGMLDEILFLSREHCLMAAGTIGRIHTLHSYTHTLYSCTALMHSYTVLIHCAHTLCSYTVLIHCAHTLCSYTILIHCAHTLHPWRQVRSSQS